VLPSYDLGAITTRLARLASVPDPTAERQAAVAAILRAPYDKYDETEILLMRRAEHPSDPWSGHMAFPGGRRDAADENLLAAAIRETREEVGIDLKAHGTLLARLPDVPAVARGRRLGLVIAPFVFALRGTPELSLDKEEVAEALWVPIGPLARGERASVYPYVHEGKTLDLPGLRVGEHIVWGLTYQMLRILFEALHADS